MRAVVRATGGEVSFTSRAICLITPGVGRSHHQAVHPLFQNPQGGAGALDVAHLHKDVAALRHQVFQGDDGPVRGPNHHRPLAGQADDLGFVGGAQDGDFVQVLPRRQVAVREQ